MAPIPIIRPLCHRLSDCGFCSPYVQPCEIPRRNGAIIPRHTPSVAALLFRLLSFGSGASTSRRPVCRTDLYRAADGRDGATHSPFDAPRNIRRNGQAQQAPAEYPPPPNTQYRGRVRLIWFSFSLSDSAICRRQVAPHAGA